MRNFLVLSCLAFLTILSSDVRHGKEQGNPTNQQALLNAYKVISKFFTDFIIIIEDESAAKATGSFDLDAFMAKRRGLLTMSSALIMKQQFPITHPMINAELARIAMTSLNRSMVDDCKRTGALKMMTADELMVTFNVLIDAAKGCEYICKLLRNARALLFWRYVRYMATTLEGLDEYFGENHFVTEASEWQTIVGSLYAFRYYNPHDPYRHLLDIEFIGLMISLKKTRDFVSEVFNRSPYWYEALELYDLMSRKANLKSWLSKSNKRLEIEEAFFKWIAEGKLVPNPSSGKLMVSSDCPDSFLKELSSVCVRAFQLKAKMPRFELDKAEYVYVNEYFGEKRLAFPAKLVEMLETRIEKYESLVCHTPMTVSLLSKLPAAMQHAVMTDAEAGDIYMYQICGVAYAPRGLVNIQARVNFMEGEKTGKNNLLAFITEHDGRFRIMFKELTADKCAERIKSLKVARTVENYKKCVITRWDIEASSTNAVEIQKPVDPSQPPSAPIETADCAQANNETGESSMTVPTAPVDTQGSSMQSPECLD